MENTILTPGQLLVLCILRGVLVAAKNIDNYEWTMRHESFFNDQNVSKYGPDTKGVKALQDAFKQEVKEKFPAQAPKLRNFYSRWSEGAYSLSDFDEDLSWWNSTSFTDWHYKGKFELKETLSEKEKYILFELLPKFEFKRPGTMSTFAY